jgi:hypothetical protein
LIPLCKCGCGKPVSFIEKGDRKRGIKAGTPRKFASRECYWHYEQDHCKRGHLYSYYPGGRKKCRICNAARKLAKETGLSIVDILNHPSSGKCDICEVVPSGERWDCLQLDHDHKTGFIRGWLCGRCNRALGLLGDDIEVLKMAYLYLEVSKFVQESDGWANVLS